MRLIVGIVFTLLAFPSGLLAGEGRLRVEPAEVRLSGRGAVWTLLIDRQEGQRTVDVTRIARITSSDPEIVSVSGPGVLRAVADGDAILDIAHEGQTLTVKVHVEGTQVPRAIHFEQDILPILSRYGCNTSGCHGKAEGQNGFKLSVFGFDPAADHQALTQEGRGRRVSASDPDRSLLLQKAGGALPHGGGVRIPRGSDEYELLAAWIDAGVPVGRTDAPHVTSIAVSPRERQMSFRAQQQLRVVATYSDGRQVDVTRHAKFQSNNDALGTVDDTGLVTAGDAPGDVAVMASYMGAVDVFRALLPRAESVEPYPSLPERNFIDGLVHAKLRKLGILPSDEATDADFLRRVSLDVTGTLPTSDEARKFLADTAPDRRAKLVDQLLERPEFATFWALKWADVLRVDRQALGHAGAYAYYRWIRESLAENKPYDQFCRELLTAEGPLDDAPAGQFYKVVADPGARAGTISQAFLGVRIECAQCHHHPFDRWSQTDYFGMHAFFTGTSVQGRNGVETLIGSKDGSSAHPRTGETIFAHPLGEPRPSAQPEGDRRRKLAGWMTAPGNPWFARNFVNRTWAHFLGRGLVEPVDDFRLTNPPSNPELLDALARHFVDSKYDVRQLIRTITSSRTYQLSCTPNDTNRADDQNFSRVLFKRLDAEVLMDGVCQTTGVPEKFPGVPAGSRAIELWDSQVSHYFLKLFGRPTRVTACECERTAEPSVSQVLHVMNSPELHAKLSHEAGRVARLVGEFPDDAALVEEIYLTCYARRPTDTERDLAVVHLKKHAADRRAAAEDLMWSLLNTVEFLFNH